MNERYQLWPCAFVNGVFSVPDEILSFLWRELERTGKYRDLFYNGGVATEEQWIAWVKDAGNYPVLAVDLVSMKIAGIAWLNNAVDGAALIHFCMLGLPRPEIGETVLRYWSGMGALSVIVGFTPDTNMAAVKYAKRIGFTVSGYIPKMCNMIYEGRRVGAVVTTYLVKKEAANGRREEGIHASTVAV
jgi:hypothetical protein